MKIDIAPAWASGLVLDIALETHDLPDLLVKYGLSESALDALYANAQFRRELLNTRAELSQSGSTFRAHARVLAEEHLVTMNDMMNDPDTPNSVKMQVWQSFVKYAALEPPKDSAVALPGGLTINIAGFAAAPPQPPSIDVTATPTPPPSVHTLPIDRD